MTDKPPPKDASREGSLDAPFRHPIAWKDEAYYDLAAVGLRHPVDLAGLALVDQVEQAGKGVAQIEAAAAAVTDVEDALHLRFCLAAIGETSLNLKAAIAGETHEYTDMYPGMARTAREENFDEIADWFETLAKAEKSHAGRFQRALDTLD